MLTSKAHYIRRRTEHTSMGGRKAAPLGELIGGNMSLHYSLDEKSAIYWEEDVKTHPHGQHQCFSVAIGQDIGALKGRGNGIRLLDMRVVTTTAAWI